MTEARALLHLLDLLAWLAARGGRISFETDAHGRPVLVARARMGPYGYERAATVDLAVPEGADAGVPTAVALSVAVCRLRHLERRGRLAARHRGPG